MKQGFTLSIIRWVITQHVFKLEFNACYPLAYTKMDNVKLSNQFLFCLIIILCSNKVGDLSRRSPEGSLFSTATTARRKRRALLHSLDRSNLPLILTL